LATDRSDYVGGLYLQANRYISFSAQSRFDEDNFGIQRTDLGARANYGLIEARVNYADVLGQPILIGDAAAEGEEAQVVTSESVLAANQDREEIVGAAALSITDRWALLGNLRYDLTADQTITDGLGLRYQDDCFRLDVTYQRSFIEDQDIEPDQRFLVNFMLKYLGSYQFATEAFGPFGAEGSDTNE
jgi:LPS-assembly protein